MGLPEWNEGIDFSRPGKPTDNAFVESFNGTFRSECLDMPTGSALWKMPDISSKPGDREYNVESSSQGSSANRTLRSRIAKSRSAPRYDVHTQNQLKTKPQPVQIFQALQPAEKLNLNLVQIFSRPFKPAKD